MSKPQTGQEKLDPSQMFHDAFIYREAAAHLTNTATRAPAQPALFFPAITVSALSSEIFLKCLLAVKYKGLIPRSIQRRHDLRELFDELPHTHTTIEKHWNAMAANNPLFKIKDGGFANQDTSLKACITAGSKAFEKYRYVYEQKDIPSFSLQHLPDILIQSISELEPSVPRYPAVVTNLNPFRVAIQPDGKLAMAFAGP